MSDQLVRTSNDKWIAGVCGGLAKRFGVSSGMVRLGFVLFGHLSGIGELVYIAMWIVIPKE